jgi:hypothetical protein
MEKNFSKKNNSSLESENANIKRNLNTYYFNYFILIHSPRESSIKKYSLFSIIITFENFCFITLFKLL